MPSFNRKKKSIRSIYWNLEARWCEILCRGASADLLNLSRMKMVNIFWEKTCRCGETGHCETTDFTA